MPTTCSLIFAHRGFRLLADDVEGRVQTGTLQEGVHLRGEWVEALFSFIREVLPGWRDDPLRPAQTGETSLTAQLCARLTSATRHAAGWDFVQFRREEPDENDARRSIDLVVAPSGTLIWVEGRRYTEYETLVPIECKRLPTPAGSDRDEREYLYSQFKSTGGVQRFKAGHHAASHHRAGMIAYIQARTIPDWTTQLGMWVDELEATPVEGWSVADKLALVEYDQPLRTGTLRSRHTRRSDLEDIEIDHLWIEC